MGYVRQSDRMGLARPPALSIPPRRQPPRRLLTILQDGIVLETGSRAHVLRPLWAAEAMHRAHSLNQLVTRLEAGRIGAGNAIGRRIEHDLALDIARLYRATSHLPAPSVVACSALLRDLASDLVALFGSTAGGVTLQTHVEPVSLPGFQARALTLAVSELVINALTHAFPAGRGGTIGLDLRLVAPRQARLRITDDGTGGAGGREGIATALAELLESDLVCRPGEPGGTIAEITFPVLDIAR